jgi:hypothetical protein
LTIKSGNPIRFWCITEPEEPKMAKALTLKLTQEQQQQLERIRDRDPKPYLRERAAALLQIAAGASVYGVASQGLLKAHDHETIAEWRRRYQKDGLKGLLIQAGRGRKPAFSPSAPRRRRR